MAGTFVERKRNHAAVYLFGRAAVYDLRKSGLIKQIRLFPRDHIPKRLILKPTHVRSAHLFLGRQRAFR